MIDRTTLETVLDDAAAGLDDIDKSRTGGGIAWSVGAVTFAVLTDEAVELRLDPAIAEAASRTPDTAPSARGPEWVRFSPPTLDDHALDRLEAWLMLARRRAGSVPRNPK